MPSPFSQAVGYQGGGEVEAVENEVVGMFRLDVIPREHTAREVAQVECHDRLGARADGGRHDVPIIRIRQREPFDQRCLLVDHRARERDVHELARSREASDVQRGVQHACVVNDG